MPWEFWIGLLGDDPVLFEGYGQAVLCFIKCFTASLISNFWVPVISCSSYFYNPKWLKILPYCFSGPKITLIESVQVVINFINTFFFYTLTLYYPLHTQCYCWTVKCSFWSIIKSSLCFWRSESHNISFQMSICPSLTYILINLEIIGIFVKLIFLIHDHLFRIFYFKTSGDRMASNSTSWGLELHVWPPYSVLFACFYRFIFRTHEWMLVCLSGCFYVSATQACSAFNSL